MKGYNFVIIGKSGTGKSSLLNYMLGANKAKTGSGKPVTGETFDKFSTTISGSEINIYDSWGLEAGKTDRWEELFDAFLQKKKKETKVENWIHTVVFCVSGSGKRLEPFEERILNKLKDQMLNPVLVITKSDKDKDDVFYSSLKKQFKIDPIKVCSVNKVVGIGLNKVVSEPSGLEDLLEKIQINTIKSYEERVSIIQKTILEQRKFEGIYEVNESIKIFIKEQNRFDHTAFENINSKLIHLITDFDNKTQKSINDLVDDAKDYFQNEILNGMKFSSKQLKNVSYDSFLYLNEKKLIFLPWNPYLSVVYTAINLYDFHEKMTADCDVAIKDHFEKSYQFEVSKKQVMSFHKN